ncbi:MAG: protelomerase family protein [Cyanobacteria bacterium J06632_19]
MTYTTEKLNDLTKKEVYEIARAIATDKGITGISKFTKGKLMTFILENQAETETAPETAPEPTPEATPETNPESIPTPEEFFETVKVIEKRLEVSRACNGLLAQLGDKYTTATVSRKLSEYKKPFYNFQHSDPKLNETVPTKNGTNTQHIAANLLTLSDEQSEELRTEREKSELSRRGIDEDGDIRDIELPPQEIKSIVEKACSLLVSSNPVDIACGLLPLTGLRKNEQNMPAIEYDSGVVIREWKVIGEFLIAIKGLSKKGGNDGWFSRATLAPAQMIVDAQKRFLASPKVKAIPSNYETYNNGGFRKAVDRKFKEIWETEFSTIEAYDDNGNKIANNASTHKARAFYTWALVPVLKVNGFNEKQAKLYVKNCLGHDDEKDTSKYFNRYDEDQFIEAIDINIPTNFKEIGLLDSATVEKLHEEYATETEATGQVEQSEAEPTGQVDPTEETKNNGFDVTRFVEGIPEELQVKFTKLITDGVDVTTALIEVVNTARNTQNQTEPKPSVSEKINEILIAVMDYNQEQPEVKNILVPTYAACNRIHKLWEGKEVARSTFEEVWKEFGRDITERLENRGIPNISRADAKSEGLVSQEMHNGKYHRKDMEEVAAKIVELLNS